MKTRSNREWLEELKGTGPEQAAALADLRALLLRAALYTLRRTQYDLGRLDGEAKRQLAEDSAQEALLAVLKHLDEFRGESKFTTWAYKFGINMMLLAARHESRRNVSLEEVFESIDTGELFLPDTSEGADPPRAAWQTEVWGVVRDVIENDLTERQRQVLVSVVFQDVPLDEVAGYLGSNRNAMYKTLHDARLKLKKRLAARGLLEHEIMDAFAR
ncbi:MAG: RNA polymerase sigma factor [Rudaea sp.]